MKNLFKKFSTGILVAYAEAQEVAKDNRNKKAKKREERKIAKEKAREWRESVDCPYCNLHYSIKDIYKHEVEVEELDLKERDCDLWVQVSFINCRGCKTIFGIKTIHYHGVCCDTDRTGLNLIDDTAN